MPSDYFNSRMLFLSILFYYIINSILIKKIRIKKYMSVRVLNMFAQFPVMLELSMNVCTQGCDYCYAKYWKHENVSIDKIINQILSLETKKEGVVPFLIRNRSAISISNRTDIMSLANWREVLFALKKLGFPLFIETKLNKDYKDLIEILDLEKDIVFQSITGFNNKHEERNILSAEEKIEAAKWLNENGVYHILAVNPFLPDKISVDEIKKMIEIIKPRQFYSYRYHTVSKRIFQHLYMKEFPKEINEKAFQEMRRYCLDNNIVHSVSGIEKYLEQRLDLEGYLAINKRLFNNKHFSYMKQFIHYNKFNEDKNLEFIEYDFETFLHDYEEEIEYFKPCIFKSSDFPITLNSNYKWNYKRFDIFYFLNTFWNFRKLSLFDYYSDKEDAKGNLIHCKFRDDLI